MSDHHEAREAGRVSAMAARSQREMRRWAADYPVLYAAETFDPTLFSMSALGVAFSAPWFSIEQLRMANRVNLWVFGLDWSIDAVARNYGEAAEIVRRVEAVADGAPAVPGDDLTRFLADLREELLPHSPVWRDELRLTLDAMMREWEWKDAGVLPTFEDYLANADNIGYSLVFAGHWAANGGSGDVQAVREASWAVQRVVRLVNDIGSYERDVKWGDLNAFMLDVERAEVMERVSELTAEVIRLTEDVPKEHGEYLRRQMEFCKGFYAVADFWGLP